MKRTLSVGRNMAVVVALLGSMAYSSVSCGQAAAPPSGADVGRAQESDAEYRQQIGPQRGGKGATKGLGSAWVRLVRDKDDTPLAMETAVVRYVPESDVDPSKASDSYASYVDLVGAVHIGDLAYYRILNKRFRSYDAVLYELVAPEGTVVPRGRGTSSDHPLGALQNGMKSMLEVEHQLEQVDYTRPNFVHADLSPDQFFESMEKRDETFVEMYFRILGASLAQQSRQSAQGESADWDIMAAFFAEDRARQLKIALAKQFEGMETLMLGFSGSDGSTIISERNRKALDVLEEQLGEKKAKLAIFYGAGHLSEMHDSMQERFHYRPVGIDWIEAWDLREK